MKQWWGILAALGLALAAPAPAAAQIAMRYRLLEPAVVPADGSSGALLTVRTEGSVSSVTFEPAAGGPARAMVPLNEHDWALVLAPADLLHDYQADDVNRNFAGFVNLSDAGGNTARYNVFVNVADTATPAVRVVDLAPDVRCTRHVVNVYVPAGDPLGTDPTAESLLRRNAIKRFYQLFADRYEMVNVVLTMPVRTENRTHFPVRNQVQGIGMSLFDNTAIYGSGGRLLGVNQFPLDSFFDMAEGGSLHEMGHQWINNLPQTLLQTGQPHWPPSDLARGLMGFNIPGSNVGGTFGYAFVPLGGGQYLVQSAVPTGEFSSLDLYLMGLLPADDVEPFVVATVPYSEIVHNATITGEQLTVEDVIASAGVRVPEAASARHNFRLATIVVSRGRLLTDQEMAFFDHFAARAAATAPVAYASGFAKGTAKPFALATRGLGTLSANIPCARRAGSPPPRRVPNASVLDGLALAVDLASIEDRGLRRRLRSRLQGASRAYRRGQVAQARAAVETFRGEVEAQSGEGVPAPAAESLTRLATQAAAVLGLSVQ